MRKRTACLAVLLLLACGIGLSSPVSAGCADCRQGGLVDKACQDEKDNRYTDCCRIFGCEIGDPGFNYCQDEGEETYNGCVILHGCPNLAS